MQRTGRTTLEWSRLFRHDSGRFVDVDDGSAERARVDLAQAEVRIDTQQVGMFERAEPTTPELHSILDAHGEARNYPNGGARTLRCLQQSIAPGDRVYVLGIARPLAVHDAAANSAPRLILAGGDDDDSELLVSTMSDEDLAVDLLGSTVGIYVCLALGLGGMIAGLALGLHA